MTKLFFSLTCLLFFVSLSAQHKDHKRDKKAALEELNLSEDQKQQFTDLRNNLKEDLSVLKSSEVSKEEKMSMHESLLADYRGELATFLSDAQLATIDRLYESRREKHADKMERRKDKAEELGLTDAQKEQLGAIKKKAAHEFEIIRNADLEKDEQREKLRLVKSQVDEDVKAVLTPSQYEVWASDRKKHRRSGR